jgi:sarcosine reductase
MRFELTSVRVTALVLGDETVWRDGTLTVGRDRAVSVLRSVAGVRSARVDVASPGESTRIVHALDAVEPRRRSDGCAYPGIDGPVQMAGDGQTARLGDTAVIVSCEVPWNSRGGLLVPREGIVDMSGPAAMFSPMSRTHNVVAVIDLERDLSDDASERATRAAGFRLAAHLADVTRHAVANSCESFELTAAPALPRVVYINQIQSQGLWARTFLYGHALDDQLPLLLHPNEVLDGALVSGNQVYQNHKVPTWLHANNPVVRRLYERHGRDVDFCGVIVSKGYFYSDEAKARSALMTARLAAQMGAAGAVISWEGGGNSIVEAMLTAQACERRGIRTSMLAYEMGDGERSALIFSVPEADALVSTANTEAPIHLPRVARVVGGDTIRLRPERGGGHVDAAGPLELEATYELYCAANRLGAGPFEVQTW